MKSCSQSRVCPRYFARIAVAVLLLTSGAFAADPLEQSFLRPPDAARPWVYWFWLNGNITKEGITADLEAMKRVGIRGVLIMEVDQGTPVGPVDFMGGEWRELFKHVHKEARRLDLLVNMNNDAGWNGSGGPWITPETAMQKVVWAETELTGPRHFDATLKEPENNGFYRDITLLAFPRSGSYRIPNIRSKAAFEMGSVGIGPATNLAPEMVVIRKQVQVITRKMDQNGRLVWDVPEGDWTVVRFGHTTTDVENAPAPKSGRGLECDKLSKAGIEANFKGMMQALIDDNRIKPGDQKFGLVATHIDSWENGSQNWTPRMRQDFYDRRGYDLETWLPVLTGRVVDSLELTERFLWDLRQTVSELVVENYAGRMAELAHENGLKFTVEAYGSPCDYLPYAGQSDEPMGEFWTPSGSALETCKGMASAAHIYGKRIVGAEAFTAGDHERWLEHPATLKTLGDRAFCEGINRFVFHRYAMQPWVPERRPGMMMGPWGQHYERTQTWWEESAAWHDYLARCQFLLRQGLFVADICYLQPEAPPQGFGSHPRAGYDWDECSAEVLLRRMSVAQTQLVLPDGMSYRVLVLPNASAMTPGLLKRVRDLAEAGAIVIGAPPEKSPSLQRYPRCDEEIKKIVAELWADCDGVNMKTRKFGKGLVVRGMQAEEYLRETGVRPDFAGHRQLRYIHRSTDFGDVYFVASGSKSELSTSAAFRVLGRAPELWWPDTGRIERAPVYHQTNGTTVVGLQLPPGGSVFVIFRRSLPVEDPILSLQQDAKVILSASAPSFVPITINSATYGIPGDTQRTRDVRAMVQARVDSGQTSFPVRDMAEGDDPAVGVLKTLTVTFAANGRQHTVTAQDPATIAINPNLVRAKVDRARYGVLTDPARTRNVRDRLQQLFDAGETRFKVARMAEGDDPAFMVVKTLEADYTVGDKTFHITGTDPEELDLEPEPVAPPSPVSLAIDEKAGLMLEAFKAGSYEARTVSGRVLRRQLGAIPEPVELTGPWQVRFDEAGGSTVKPARSATSLEFDRLISWSEHNDPRVKYFSGSATYSMRVNIPDAMLGKNNRVYLDLGMVQVMAQVKVNGRDLGWLWKAPFRSEITKAAKRGENRVEITVVNLWPNRLIGDEQLPEDSERNPDGTLKRWPEWLLAGKPSPAGRTTFVSWRLWKKQDALVPSGLLGPARLCCSEVTPFK